MLRFVFHLLLALGANGCTRCAGSGISDPGLDIQVEKNTSGYLLHVRTCEGSAIGISWLQVRSASDSEHVSRCELSALHSSAPRIKGHWQYGTIAPGYDLAGCEPLRPGSTYIVEATGAGGGYRAFRVKLDGGVELGDGSCTR